MKRVWGHVVVGVTLIGCGVVLVPACKHDDSTLFVQNVLAAPLVTAGEACVFSSDPTQAAIPSGTLDVGLRGEYDATFLIGNQSVAQANSQQLRTETNIITIQGAIVRITDASGNELNTYTRATSATVYPSTGNVPGYAPATVTILDSSTLSGDTALQSNVAQQGTSRLVTYTKFFGQTTGGDYEESDEFEFPVDVCSGCLVGFSAADENPLEPEPNCALAAANATAVSLPVPCVIGQDSVVDCSACQGYAVCRGAAPTPTIDAGTGDAASE